MCFFLSPSLVYFFAASGLQFPQKLRSEVPPPNREFWALPKDPPPFRWSGLRFQRHRWLNLSSFCSFRTGSAFIFPVLRSRASLVLVSRVWSEDFRSPINLDFARLPPWRVPWDLKSLPSTPPRRLDLHGIHGCRVVFLLSPYAKVLSPPFSLFFLFSFPRLASSLLISGLSPLSPHPTRFALLPASTFSFCPSRPFLYRSPFRAFSSC